MQSDKILKKKLTFPLHKDLKEEEKSITIFIVLKFSLLCGR